MWRLWGLSEGVMVHVSFFGGFCLFVNGGGLEPGICIGMQDCPCQCDMLKHALFFQPCHNCGGVGGTHIEGAIYTAKRLSPSTIGSSSLRSNECFFAS